jgi:alpha-tubulin suppressor-like RCC1 family protein
MKCQRNFAIIACFFILFFVLSIPAYTQTTYWTGDGGKDIRVTVPEPSGVGLSAQEQSLLPLIQSTIIGAFQRFSAMTVMDQLNLENVLRQQRQSLSGNFSDNDYIRIGNLTNARLVVFGSITKTTTSYTLELGVTDVETGERKASYLPRQVSLLALENLSAIREASADLLGQLGVNLTANALQDLRRVENTARVQAENALARGISAQRQGTTVEALTYYFQAAAFDPSLSGAINRAFVVSANISSGNLGQDVRNRLQIHDEWRTIVTTARSFYANHLPYEFVYNTAITRGDINFERRTTSLSIAISLIPTNAWETINNLRNGLTNARQRNETWNFNLNQIEPVRIITTIEIVNENNIVLSRASHTFNNPSETNISNATLHFQNVRADDITDRLTVRVVSINDRPAQVAGETGFIQISSLSAYNERIAQIRATEEAARREQAEIERRQREMRMTAGAVPITQGVAMVSALSSHTVAIGKDGALLVFGGNSFNQLGDGTTTQRILPVQIGTHNDWVSVSVGNQHTVAIRKDGSLWAWGNNNRGQLGDGTTTRRNSPARIGTENNWASVSAGGDHTVAIRTDGSLWAWGSNSAGQLGDGTTTNRNIPTRIGRDRDWASVSATYSRNVAIKKDGSLWAWGFNRNRELGDGTNTNRNIPTRIGRDRDWASVSTGGRNTVAIKTDGSLWAWGVNTYGQLGDGTTTRYNTPTKIGTTTNWAYIRTGGISGREHTVAIRTDGSLWAWGNNEYGQLGDGTTTNRNIPTRIGTATNWISIVVSLYRTFAIRTDGSLWAWGRNTLTPQSYILGDGTTINRTTPVQVLPNFR